LPQGFRLRLHPVHGFSKAAVRFSGETRKFASKTAGGGDAVRNSCPICGSLEFGGEIGQHDTFMVNAGSLDDPSSFSPKIAIFARHRPPWAVIPADLVVFDEKPS
jgi:hypothetical protein